MTYILSLKIFNANMSDSLLWTDLTLSQVMQVWDSFLFVTVSGSLSAEGKRECWFTQDNGFKLMIQVCNQSVEICNSWINTSAPVKQVSAVQNYVDLAESSYFETVWESDEVNSGEVC